MCGFTGFLDHRHSLCSREARHRLKAMADVIRHRGPDAEGIGIEQTGTGAVWAGLSHRRLSILDLSEAGAQPMVSRCNRYVIAYNGEIYNYLDLRAELEAAAPMNWRGHSDTEVLLELIARHGVTAALARLDGMFGFALLDRKNRTVTLARDAFGEKPVVYGLWRGVFLFGSELRSFREWPGFAPEEDAQARAALMQYSYIPAPATIHQGVFKLPPAHIVEICSAALEAGQLPAPTPWWDMTGAALEALKTPFEGDFEAAVDAVETALERSVSRRMASDVPLGSMLSGGIDSTLTTAFMQRLSDTPISSFTIGMADEDYDESSHAEAVARHLGTQQETFRLSPSEVLDEVPVIAAKYDEPFADSSQLPTLLVSRIARSRVSVAMSGDGGDELFAGYNRYFYGPRLWSRMQRFPGSVCLATGGTLGAIPPSTLTALVRAVGPLAPRDLATGRAGEKLHKFARLLRARDRDEFHDALLRTGSAKTVLSYDVNFPAITKAADQRTHQLDFASAAMLFDSGNYLHDDILTKVDRASMAVSLETRTPFLDRDLFNLAWQIPHHFKTQGSQGKRVLRALLYRMVPQEIVNRPKTGFSMPIGRWLRGPLADWAHSHLCDTALARSGVFDVTAVRDLWEDHRMGRRDNETQLWNILMYQAWHEHQRMSRALQRPSAKA